MPDGAPATARQTRLLSPALGPAIFALTGVLIVSSPSSPRHDSRLHRHRLSHILAAHRAAKYSVFIRLFVRGLLLRLRRRLSIAGRVDDEHGSRTTFNAAHGDEGGWFWTTLHTCTPPPGDYAVFVTWWVIGSFALNTTMLPVVHCLATTHALPLHTHPHTHTHTPLHTHTHTRLHHTHTHTPHTHTHTATHARSLKRLATFPNCCSSPPQSAPRQNTHVGVNPPPDRQLVPTGGWKRLRPSSQTCARTLFYGLSLFRQPEFRAGLPQPQASPSPPRLPPSVAGTGTNHPWTGRFARVCLLARLPRSPHAACHALSPSAHLLRQAPLRCDLFFCVLSTHAYLPTDPPPRPRQPHTAHHTATTCASLHATSRTATYTRAPLPATPLLHFTCAPATFQLHGLPRLFLRPATSCISTAHLFLLSHYSTLATRLPATCCGARVRSTTCSLPHFPHLPSTSCLPARRAVTTTPATGTAAPTKRHHMPLHARSLPPTLLFRTTYCCGGRWLNSGRDS